MLRDRIVMITGASAGIGEACARAFAREGARLILAARRTDRLETLAADLGVPVLALALDVRDRALVEAAVADLPDAWRDVDVLVNNAGLSRGLEPVQEGDPADWEEMIDTNVKGLLWITRAVLPGMVARDRGHVINIGSVSGHDVYPGGAVYCGTKFAVHALTTGIRIDLKGTRVRCTTVDPGMVETEFSLVRFHGDAPRADAVYRNFPPLQPADVADAVVWSAARPAHVNVGEIILWPTDQKTVTLSHPRGVDRG
ncbi:MAG TPA: SDR family NAD(P)-dependent oxidoreductase [Candidatus Krumholzibacteria bacterium]|nr:SDR family NAD(P)-dependent oxidoreductase [Candidatus Krumholzibacteria bacterium]